MSLADQTMTVRPTERADAQARVDALPWSDPPELSLRTGEAAAVATRLTDLESSSFAIAIKALQRGVKEIEELHARCARLRCELSDAEDRQRERLLALQDEIVHWQDMVCDLADQYQANQSQLRDLLVEHGLARESAARDQKRAETAERRSQSFERLVMGIHDQILSAIVKDRCDTSELGTAGA